MVGIEIAFIPPGHASLGATIRAVCRGGDADRSVEFLISGGDFKGGGALLARNHKDK